MFIFVPTIIIVYCYVLLVLFSVKGWSKKEESLDSEHSYVFCSVVIAARNEADNIATTISSLLSQNYPADCFEILVVDDHSTDNTLQILTELAEQNNNLFVFSAPENQNGKKAALQYVLKQAKGDLFLFTDADCIVGKNWIESYVSYANNHEGNLYFGNVIPNISNKSNILEKCFALDFIGILGVQNGLAKLGHAFSCNGANMCITKRFYQQAYDTNSQFASGDDVFLLHKAKQIDKNSVFFVQDKRAAIQTDIPNTVKSFIKQRCRWASKATGYKDKDSILVAVIVYIYCLAMTITAIASCFGNIQLFVAFTLLFISKCVTDIILFTATRKHYKSANYIWLAVPFECIYFLYITIIPILAKLRPVQWKSRAIHNA